MDGCSRPRGQRLVAIKIEGGAVGMHHVRVSLQRQLRRSFLPPFSSTTSLLLRNASIYVRVQTQCELINNADIASWRYLYDMARRRK